MLDNLEPAAPVKVEKAAKVTPIVRPRIPATSANVRQHVTVKSEVPSSPPVGMGAENLTSLPLEASSPTPAQIDHTTPATQDMDMDDAGSDDDLNLHTLKPATMIKQHIDIKSVSAPKLGMLMKKPVEHSSDPISDVPVEEVPSVSFSDLGNIDVAENVIQTYETTSGAIANNLKSFFWTDYHEASYRLVLFGKAKIQEDGKKEQLINCSVIVNDLKRAIYFLPRDHRSSRPDEKVQFGDVYEEISKWIEKSRKGGDRAPKFLVKAVTRKYCFEKENVPKEAQYLKLLIPFTFTEEFPSSGDTYSHVFGSHTAMFEQFVLARKVKGPCWFNLNEPRLVNAKATRSALEIELKSPFDLTPMEQQSATPPLNIMALSLRTAMNKKTDKQEIVAITACTYKNMHIDPVESDAPPTRSLFTIVRPVNQEFSLEFKDALKKQRRYANMKGHLDGSIIIKTSELEVIREFLDRIGAADPDVILGHQLEAVHLPVLVHRAKELKMLHKWDQLGRLKRTNWPHFNSASIFSLKQIFCGRLLCDLYNTMGQSLTTICDTWSLTEMTSKYLDNVVRADWDVDIMKYDARDKPDGLVRFLKHSENDTQIVMRIAVAIQILPLTKQLTEIAGNSWAGTLSGSRAQRNEFILLHEFTREGYLVPDKMKAVHHHQQKQARQEQQEQQEEGEILPSKSKYQGGKVLDPIQGLYRTIVLVLDFNSLYPSIIREFNICFTTIDYSKYADGEGTENMELPDSSVKQGIFPRLIETLVETRKYVKAEMKKAVDPRQKKRFDIKQQALKLTANSMYGCLGFEYSRFYALPLAMTITQKGRDILTSTCELAENNSLQVVYGDTDSVMINTNVYWDKQAAKTKAAELLAALAKNGIGSDLSIDQKQALVEKLAKARELKIAFDKAIQIGNQFKSIVNEQYKSLELDIDNIFKTLLLNAKKKYAAVDLTYKKYLQEVTNNKSVDSFVSEVVKMGEISSMMVEKPVIKGLDLVRREYCELSKQASRYALDQILSDEAVEEAVENIHDYLRELAATVRNDTVKPFKYLIRRKLNKSPKDYSGSSRDSAHVQVALRRIEQGDLLGKDDVISYIVTTGKDGDTSTPYFRRSYTLDEFKTMELKPDVDYYLLNQVLLPLERVCHNIDGIDRYSIAECLGLKVHQSRYYNEASESKGTYIPLDFTISDEERFARAEPLKITCQCQNKFELKFLAAGSYDTICTDGIKCPKCSQLVRQTRVNAQLECALRHEIAKYYNAWLACSECGMRTRQISVYGRRCLRKEDGSKCNGVMNYEYTSKLMYYQLQYYKKLFDVDSARKNAVVRLSDAEAALYDKSRLYSENEINTIAEMNRERFSKTQSIVDKYIADCGRAFVDMREIFG